jgi:hypothetical protein
MNRTPSEHRQEYEEIGYTIFEGVLPESDIQSALPIFDEIITPDTEPPIICSNTGARRQLNSAEYCEPRLSKFGGHPAVLETVAALVDRPFRLTRSPVPTVTYSGKAGGLPGKNWSGHVDWYSTPPGELDSLNVLGIVHFTTIAPSGGGFTVVPGSHHVVSENLDNPELCERMFSQNFREFPGLDDEQEMRAKAGDVLYYHPFMVHGASDNQSDTVRKVVHTHYFPLLGAEHESAERETIITRFHSSHLAVMDDAFKELIGFASE